MRSAEKERSDISQQTRRTDTRLAWSTMWRRGPTVLLGHQFVSAAGGRLAARRAVALALVYHRVRPEPIAEYEVVPCVPVEQFRRQVEALRTMGEIVSIDELITGTRSRRPRFALTFDDDYASHFHHVLPLLRRMGVTATFFLSGRTLHGLGPYWWEVLEAWMRQDGPERVARALHVSGAEPQAIAAACEEDDARQQEVEANAADTGDHLRRGQISALAAAGMTIGFHTVKHQVLPRLTPQDRYRALREGRQELQDLTGQRLTALAYPHGRSDPATAADARSAGYAAAWTGAGRAVSGRSDRWRLGRWEPGAIDASVLRARALARLLRPAAADG